ncbi:uncharacterized protein LOC124181983 [Neodiprion fabricii]|uniref:uncharacterized protein LOC124181983 n=1 Tax=Neodiprion fabricii TaxID=2872261 RepID=UPI001ED8D4CC|nr:uncharacterized protein LOC124181983 [Neodiprion fabricii]
MSNTIDSLAELLKKVSETVNETKSEVNKIGKTTEDLSTSVKEVGNELKEWTGRCRALEQKYEDHKERIDNIEMKIHFLLKQEREKNLMMFKVPDTLEVNGDLNKSVMEIFRTTGIGIAERDVEAIFRVGKKNMKLKNTGVILEKDLSKIEREKKEKLRLLKMDLEKHGKTVKVKGFKLLVDQQFMTYQEAEKKLNSFEKQIQQNVESVPFTPKKTKKQELRKISSANGTEKHQ